MVNGEWMGADVDRCGDERMLTDVNRYEDGRCERTTGGRALTDVNGRERSVEENLVVAWRLATSM